MRAKCKTHLILSIILLFLSPIFSPKADLWANETSKYLDSVREFADNADEVLYNHIQDYVFPDVNQLPSHKGLPDLFVMSDGSRVRTEEDWDEQRRYLKAMLAHYQYGHMPPKPKDVTIQVRESTVIYGGEGIWTRFDIVVSRKGKDLRIRAGILRPNKEGQFPVIINNDEFLFHTSEVKKLLLRRIYDEGKCDEIEEFVRREAIRRGYVIFKFIRSDLAVDEKYLGTDISLGQKGNERKGVSLMYPEYDWGTIAAWAWGYQIAIDILKQEPSIDPKKIVATGHARGGKAALCAGIYDERILVTAPHVSGDGGTGSWRFFDTKRDPEGLIRYKFFGGEYFWVPKLFLFTGREDRMPFDAHFAKALIAPRVLLNMCVREDYGANPYGTYLTHLAAQPVFDLLGVGHNCLIYWRNGNDHVQREEDWLVLFDVCDKVFFGKEISHNFNNNPFPDRYQFDVLMDLNSRGKTSLHWSVQRGRLDVVELLLSRGVEINVKNLYGETPLDLAVQNGELDIAKFLVEKGADINVTDNRGDTLLHRAAERNQKDLVVFLIDVGADMSVQNNIAETPLGTAVRREYKDIVEFLISKGADINEITNRGEAVLHRTVRYGRKDMAEFLIEKGADVNIKNKSGQMPLDIAVERGHAQIVEILRKHGAKEDREEEKR